MAVIGQDSELDTLPSFWNVNSIKIADNVVLYAHKTFTQTCTIVPKVTF